jgi:two-component system, NarL family, nitrate/nitrite response regulator NarL
MTGAPRGRPRGGLVLLDAKDPARGRALAALLSEAGHAVAEDGAAPWGVALVDLAPGEEPPAIAGNRPLVLLADHLDAEAGSAVSVLPRNAPAHQVEAAVTAAAAGLVVRVPGAAMPPATPPPGFARDDPGAALLTPREVEILAMVGDGASNKAVARRLGISAHTVKFHLEAVFRKLGVTTRAEAVARGLRQRLIEM